MERVVFQSMAYKKEVVPGEIPHQCLEKDRPYEIFKAHCFRPGVYLDTPALKYRYTQKEENERTAGGARLPEAENGRTVIVTGRDYMDEIIAKGKFIYRVTVSWNCNALPTGSAGRQRRRGSGESHRCSS